MLSTLRRRFILSHIVPVLVMVPLVGIALIYMLEARVILPNLSREILSQANLVVHIAQNQPEIWSSPAQAQAFVDDLSRT